MRAVINRGVLASLAISAFLQEMGAEPAVGVATGIAFCGVVGHPGGRREYTVLGDIVNLSARLMQRATEKQGFIFLLFIGTPLKKNPSIRL